MSRDRDEADDAPRSRRDGGGGGGREVPNNLVIAIVSVFCCWPLAIFAIIKAVSVNKLAGEGDYAGAEKAAADAKKFAMIGIIIGVVVYAIWGIVVVVGIVAAGAAANAK